MKNRILITGYFGFGNTGDEAILLAMVSHLRSIRPSLQITVTSAEPAQTAASCGVEAILWSDVLALMEAVQSTDLVLIGGGGIFHDYFGFDATAFLTDNHSGIAFYTAPAVIAALSGKPVMLYAIGVGPLLTKTGERFTRLACELAQVVTVRDEGSKNILAELGVDGGKIEVTADPAFGFQAATSAALAEPGTGYPLIAVAIRNWDVGVEPGYWEAELAAALDTILERMPGSVIFYPFQVLSGLDTDDVAAAQRVHARMKYADRALLAQPPLSPEQLFDALSRSDLIVGMRLHSLIFGMAARVPVVALSYDAKDEQVMRQAGLEAQILNLPSLERSALAECIERTLTASEGISASLARQVPAWRNAARLNAARAISLLDAEAIVRPVVSAEVLQLISGGLLAQMRESHGRGVEERRLHAEIDFYLKQSRDQEAIAATERRQAESFAREKEELTVELSDVRGKHEKATVDLEARLAEIAAYRPRVAELEKQLAQERKRDTAERVLAGKALARLAAGGAGFESAFTSRLDELRKQRAWRVMLAIRKAYTLSNRQGWRGKLSVPKVAWDLIANPRETFAEYDVRFPSVQDYLPSAVLKTAIEPGRAPGPAGGLPAKVDGPSAT